MAKDQALYDNRTDSQPLQQPGQEAKPQPLQQVSPKWSGSGHWSLLVPMFCPQFQQKPKYTP